ncbi:MAG: hypothetical protein K0R14_1370 [Burkholderiales bacterium]|jgi:hypothetical protein|nr:hypothetical protein [Burkholderiales bacterium]
MRIFKQIIKLCNDLLDLVDSETDLEQQLIILQFIASIYWDNDTKTYFSYRLETKLLELSKRIINVAADDINSKNNQVLHVMTKAYLAGGHTRVVNNWIKCLGGEHSVFFNDSNIDEVPNFLKLTVANAGGEIILNKGKLLSEKAAWLFKVASQYKYVVLHHHPDDILPLLAFGNSYFKRPVFLYNHADHVWGCGYSVADRVLDLSAHSKNFSEKYRGIPEGTSVNVSIPVDIGQSIPPRNSANKKLIISMATAYKFKPITNLNFQDFVSQLLDSDMQIRYAVIGVDSTDPDWKALKNCYGDRVIFYGTLDKEAAKAALLEADLYVDSFPLGSATSMIEAISLGIPALSLKTPVQNMDGYAHISTTNVQDLIYKCHELLNLDSAAKQKVIQYNFEKILEIHSFAKFRENILALGSIVQHKPIELVNQANFEDEFIEQYSGFIANILEQDKIKLNMSYFSVDGLFSRICMRNQSIISGLLLTNFTPDTLYNKDNIYPLIFTAPVVQIFYAGKAEEFSEARVITHRFNFKSPNYTFSLQNLSNIKKIRFDPVNIPCLIQLKKFVIFDNNAVQHELIPVYNNADITINEKNYYAFYHSDPQLVFELPDSLSESIADCFIEMEVFNIFSTNKISWTSELYNQFVQDNVMNNTQLEYMYRLNQELHDQLTSINKRNKSLTQQLTNTYNINKETVLQLGVANSKNQELQSENQLLRNNAHEYQRLIHIMENTISWKISKPLRYIRRMFK